MVLCIWIEKLSYEYNDSTIHINDDLSLGEFQEATFADVDSAKAFRDKYLDSGEAVTFQAFGVGGILAL
jgi:hypothetical protein